MAVAGRISPLSRLDAVHYVMCSVALNGCGRCPMLVVDHKWPQAYCAVIAGIALWARKDMVDLFGAHLTFVRGAFCTGSACFVCGAESHIEFFVSTDRTRKSPINNAKRTATKRLLVHNNR